MDVTRHNFQSVLQGLDEELSKASFISLDTEFTGLNDGKLDGKLQPLDTPAERYQKIRESTSKFMIIQVGLTLFYHNKKDKKWSYKSYNFYVFPNFGQFQNIRCFPEFNFLCQASSISFLSNNDFDFNKLFKNGICYLNLSDEDKVKKGIEEKLKVSDSTNPTTPSAASQIVAIPDEQRSWMKDTMAKIEDFLKADDDEQKELILENTSPFQRKLLFGHGKKKFPSAFFDSKNKENGDRIMLISKTAPESKKDVMWDELEQAVGFRKVLKKISDSGKLVVVHNSFLDIAHIIRQFYADLPADYEDFKALAQSVFPRFLDTKVMASSQPFRERLPNSALGQLLQALSKDPFKLGDISPIPDVPHYTLSQTKAHEAGYDSFITGLCFISMSNFLETLGGNSDRAEIAESGFVNAFTQKIFMMMSQDIPYLCLDGPDLDPPRDNIFYMTFPKTWKLHDIQHLFSVYGPVYVNWNGDSAAFVTILHKENKNLILDNIHPPIGCVLRTYQSFKESSNPLGPSVEDDAPNKSIHPKSSDSLGSSAENGRRKKPNEKRSAEPTPSTDTTPATKKVRRSLNGNKEPTVTNPKTDTTILPRRIQIGNKESTVADPKTPLFEESEDWGSDSD